MFEEVCRILSEQLIVEADAIKPESRLKEDLGADSLDMLQLLMTLEEEKGVTIPDDVLPTLRTVGEIVAYLEEQK